MTLGTDDCQGEWAVKDERQDTEEQGPLAQRARKTSSHIEEAFLMDGTQDTETHEVREQPQPTRRRFGSAGSLFLIMSLAAALHGALFSAFDVIAPLEVDETENVVLIVDTPVHVSSFIADVR